MATYRVVSWNGIPSCVEAEAGGETARVPLSRRFQDLIDAVAMRTGATDGAAYLEGWQHGSPGERPGSARSVAEAVARELEGSFEEIVTRHLRPPSP